MAEPVAKGLAAVGRGGYAGPLGRADGRGTGHMPPVALQWSMAGSPGSPPWVGPTWVHDAGRGRRPVGGGSAGTIRDRHRDLRPHARGSSWDSGRGWRSILVGTRASEGGPKNPPYGHSDEVPGGGCRRPVGGRCWELRGRGDLQGHAGVDPDPAEAHGRGRRATGLLRRGVRTCMRDDRVQRSPPCVGRVEVAPRPAAPEGPRPAGLP